MFYVVDKYSDRIQLNLPFVQVVLTTEEFFVIVVVVVESQLQGFYLGFYTKDFSKTYSFPSNFSILFKTEKYVLIFSTSNEIAIKKNIFLKLIDFTTKFSINLIKN